MMTRQINRLPHRWRKVNRLLVCAFLAAHLLAACATQPKSWYREGASGQEFEMDKGQCQAQGFAAPGMYTMQMALIFTSCMRGKGWQLVDG